MKGFVYGIAGFILMSYGWAHVGWADPPPPMAEEAHSLENDDEEEESNPARTVTPTESAEAAAAPTEKDEYLISVEGIRDFQHLLSVQKAFFNVFGKKADIEKRSVARGRVTFYVKSTVSRDHLKESLEGASSDLLAIRVLQQDGGDVRVRVQ